MYGNIKIMLRSPVQRKYVLSIHWKNDIANIFARLNCKYERFDDIYPSDDTWSLYLSLHSAIIFTVQHGLFGSQRKPIRKKSTRRIEKNLKKIIFYSCHKSRGTGKCHTFFWSYLFHCQNNSGRALLRTWN